MRCITWTGDNLQDFRCRCVGGHAWLRFEQDGPWLVETTLGLRFAVGESVLFASGAVA